MNNKIDGKLGAGETITLSDRLGEISKLSDGWLDGDGKAPNAAALNWVRRNLNLIEKLSAGDSQRPRLYPTPDGGIQIEFDSNNVLIEFIIESVESSRHAGSQGSDGADCRIGRKPGSDPALIVERPAGSLTPDSLTLSGKEPVGRTDDVGYRPQERVLLTSGEIARLHAEGLECKRAERMKWDPSKGEVKIIDAKHEAKYIPGEVASVKVYLGNQLVKEVRVLVTGGWLWRLRGWVKKQLRAWTQYLSK